MNTVLKLMVAAMILELGAVLIVALLALRRDPLPPRGWDPPDAPPDDFGPLVYVESGTEPGKVYRRHS